MLQKRSSFEFERQCRAVIVGRPSDTAKSGIPIMVSSINDLIERVVISPLAPNLLFTSVTELARAFKLKATPESSEFARPRPRQNPAIRGAVPK